VTRGRCGLGGRGIPVRARLFGKGYTNAQIVSQLVVSVRPVDGHVAAVLRNVRYSDPGAGWSLPLWRNETQVTWLGAALRDYLSNQVAGHVGGY